MRILLLPLLYLLPLFAYSEEYEFHGTHFLASYGECEIEALTHIDALRNTLLLAAEKSGATILKFQDVVFSPNGFTMAILLQESHAYPEHQACFIDLFTCGNNCSSEAFAEVLEKYLKPKKICKKTLIRNELIEEQP